MMQNFQTRIGIDRAESTYRKYIIIRKQVKRFLKVKIQSSGHTPEPDRPDFYRSILFSFEGRTENDR